MIVPHHYPGIASAAPISIPSHTIKNHLYDKRNVPKLECYHPLDFVDSEESEVDTICHDCVDAEEEEEEVEEEDSFSYSYSSYSSVSSLLLLLASYISSSISSSYQNHFMPKRKSISQILMVHATPSSSSISPVRYRSSTTNLTKLLQQLQKSPTSSLVLKNYLKIDLLPDLLPNFFGWKANPDINIPTQEELQTFSNPNNLHTIDSPTNKDNTRSKPVRNRELRINSRFLLMYSFDYNARVSGYLPNHIGDTQDLIRSSHAIRKFHDKYNLGRISTLSRDKLWDNVILLARNDPLPSESVNYENYVQIEEEEEEGDDDVDDESIFPVDTRRRNHSIIKLDGCNYLPWLNMNSKKYQTVKPSGILKGGKSLCNGELPSSGLAKSQFTVKGWCNERWVSHK